MREFVIPLATGLTIFLFGMQVLRIGLESLAGKRLERWLYQFTQTPFISFLFGLISTVFLQSSSAVTVIAIGFVNARMMRFSRCVGLILGANVGTCITTEILVFPIEKYAVTILLVGTFCWLLPWRKLRFFGLAVAGLGCVFLAMQTMESIANSINEINMLQMLSIYNSVEWGLLVGTIFTAIIQSSSAAVALMMGLYNAQAISLAFGLAAVLGANVGTCITAWLASIGGSRAGKQVALAHLLINVTGLLAFYPFVFVISEWLVDSGLSPLAQIAHFQTGFNMLSALVLLPFCTAIARMVQFLLPAADD